MFFIVFCPCFIKKVQLQNRKKSRGDNLLPLKNKRPRADETTICPFNSNQGTLLDSSLAASTAPTTAAPSTVPARPAEAKLASKEERRRRRRGCEKVAERRRRRGHTEQETGEETGTRSPEAVGATVPVTTPVATTRVAEISKRVGGGFLLLGVAFDGYQVDLVDLGKTGGAEIIVGADVALEAVADDGSGVATVADDAEPRAGLVGLLSLSLGLLLGLFDGAGDFVDDRGGETGKGFENVGERVLRRLASGLFGLGLGVGGRGSLGLGRFGLGGSRSLLGVGLFGVGRKLGLGLDRSSLGSGSRSGSSRGLGSGNSLALALRNFRLGDLGHLGVRDLASVDPGRSVARSERDVELEGLGCSASEITNYKGGREEGMQS